ncbi:C40 family peptidase [Intestinibacter sp.]
MNFTNKNIITTAAVTAALVPAASLLMQDVQITHADTVEYRVVTGDSVNFRKGPSTSYESLGKLNKGDKVEYINTTNSWAQVKYNGQTGYISSKYLSTTGTKVEYRYITGDSVNVRKGPSTSYASLGKLNKGDKVEYISTSNSWAQIKYNGQTGYVSAQYISKTSTESNAQVKYVNCSSLNVRSGAGTSYSVVTSITLNTQVEVLSTSNGWSKIKVGSTTGYVSSKYLSDTKTSSNNSSDNMSNSSTSASKLVTYAKSLLGKPYVWGAQGPSSFDCSGFTYYVFKNSVNITLPRTSSDQSTYGTTVSKSNLKVGDLVFFDTNGSNDGNVSHVGIYIGSNQFIHSSSSKGKVVISDFTTYYNNAFVRAKRVL